MKLELIYKWLDLNMEKDNVSGPIKNIKQYIEMYVSILRKDSSISKPLIASLELFSDNVNNDMQERLIIKELLRQIYYGRFNDAESYERFKDLIKLFQIAGLTQKEISLVIDDRIKNNKTI